MKPTRREPEAQTHAAAQPRPAIFVAYHDGPPAIHFAGLPWRRGEAQEITREQWAAMRARGDFAPFDFRPARELAPAAELSKE